MKAAIYARYSTDKQRETSIEDQYRNCERYAKREDWKICHRYEDKAISGTSKDRPGYQQMLADAKVKLFDVLLVDDLSRLDRAGETKQLIKRMKFWGVRVIGVSEGFDSDSKGYKMHAGFAEMKNEAYIDDLSEKTHRGLTGQALKGYNCGGRAFGYKHVPIFHPTDRDHYGQRVVVAVRREPDPAQAKIVKEIFAHYAEGWSPRTIADDLNRRRIPSPGSTWKRVVRRKDAKWLGSAIVAMLDNPLYIGKYIWNRSTWAKDPDTGKKQRKERPESEWIVTEDEKLRIVDRRTWGAVQARRREREALRNNQHPDLRPRQKYLFSGLLKCAECGQNFVIRDAYQYGCGSHINGGEHACSNQLHVARRLTEEKLLEGIKHKLYTPEALDRMRRRFVEMQAERKKAKRPDLEAARRELAQVEREITGMVAAVKAGTFSPALKAELEKAERERERLMAALKVDTRAADKVVQLVPNLVERYQRLVADMARVAQRDIARARAQIKTLLGGPVLLEPHKEGYLVAVVPRGNYAGLLKLVSGGTNLNLHGSGGSIPSELTAPIRIPLIPDSK